MFRSSLPKQLSFLLLLSLVTGCQESGDNSSKNLLPGPIITVESSNPQLGGSQVGTDHVNTDPPDFVIPTPVPAPTPGPISDPDVIPPIGLEPPVVTPTVVPIPPTVPVATVSVTPDILTFAAGTTIGDAEIITLTPSAAPLEGDLVLSLVSTNPGTAGFDANDISETEILITIPRGSSAVRTVPIFRQLRAAFAGNGTIVVTRDPATTAVNFPENSVNETVIVRALPGQEPPTQQPESVLAFTVDQITFTAENFVLTQSDSTGVVGHGPLFGSQAPSNTFGSATVDRKFPVPPNPFECGAALIGRRPFFVTNEENGSGVFVLGSGVNPAALVTNPVTLAGQALRFRRDSRNGILFADISPANFDEVYRINYFQSEQFNLNIASCVTEFSGGTNPIAETVLRFTQETRNVPGILRSTNRLFTLRGSAQGISEPDSSSGNGRLFGPQIQSDRPTPDDLLGLENPRFSGVQNVLDVSSNQIRTDITIVIDQIGDQPTQAALRDQRPPQQNIDSFPVNPASGSLPNVNVPGLIGRGVSSCPATADNGLVCGRFQFNQPFRETTVPGGTEDLPDVLVIDGIFVGRVAD